MSVTTFTVVGGQMMRQVKDGIVHDFVPDPLGSVVMVQDSAGATVYRAEYDPYGNVQSETGTNPSSLGYVGTLGYIKDSATSMYVRARYLLSNLGRWLTKDPLWPKQPGYVYAGAAPNMWVDPRGLKKADQGAHENKAKGCSVRMCVYWHVLGIPTHQYICANHPRQSCAGGISIDAFTDDGAICNEGVNESGIPGQVIICRTISTDCLMASQTCACIQDSRRDKPKPDYWLEGLCFGYVGNISRCACIRAANKIRNADLRGQRMMECLQGQIPIIVA